MSVAIASDGYMKINVSSALTAIAYCDTASLNITNETADITGLGSKWHEYVSTLRDWSGNMSFSLDSADAGQSAILALIKGTDRVPGVAVELALGSGLKFSGTVILTNFNPSAQVSGVVKVSCAFKGTGTLSAT